VGRGTGLVSDEWEVRNGEELRMTTTTFKDRDIELVVTGHCGGVLVCS
jgi:hypothetical protein